MAEQGDTRQAKAVLKADPRAAAAIARFEATQKRPSKSAHLGTLKSTPVKKKRRWLWMLLALLAGLLAAASWITGWGLHDLYDKILVRQLADAKRAKQTDTFWHKLPAPRTTDETEPDNLRDAGAGDAQFPDLAAAGTQAPVSSIAALVAAAHSGDTLLLPPGRYTDCAVITSANLTLRAATPGTAILDGGTCEGKAALVFRGGLLVVDGLMFRNMRVPDGNGAGIRHEQGALVVRNSVFYNNESGILSAGGSDMSLLVMNSRFVRNGSCRRASGCAHSIYANKMRKFRVDNSRFEMAAGGHFLKSRSAHVDIRHSVFDDTAGHASYLIDLPYGSNGDIRENSFHKGKFSRNRCCIIRIAAEGAKNRSNALHIDDNDAVSDVPLTAFVRNDSADAVILAHNRLAANIVSAWGPTQDQ